MTLAAFSIACVLVFFSPEALQQFGCTANAFHCFPKNPPKQRRVLLHK